MRLARQYTGEWMSADDGLLAILYKLVEVGFTIDTAFIKATIAIQKFEKAWITGLAQMYRFAPDFLMNELLRVEGNIRRLTIRIAENKRAMMIFQQGGVGGIAGAGGAPAGEGAPPEGEGGKPEEEIIVVQQGTKIILDQVKAAGDEWAKGLGTVGQMTGATDALLGRQNRLTSAVGGMVSKLQAAYTLMKGLNLLFGFFGKIFGAPMGGPMIPGLADAGRMPWKTAEGGSMAFPGLNNHSITVTRNDETIVDPVGSKPLARMFHWFEANVVGRSQASLPYSPGGTGTRIVEDRPVYLDGAEVGRIVGERLVESTKYGAGGFAGGALEHGR